MRMIRPVVCAIAVALASVVVQTQSIDPSLLSAAHWRSIGPANTGGRVNDFAVARVPGVPDAVYVATASGGVFKSTNQGTSWTPVFDRVDAMMSIGDVSVAPSNANIVWVGTGEANNRQSSSWGDGVYKSADAGHTWNAVGLKDTRHVARIVIHPTNPDVVYVAAVGIPPIPKRCTPRPISASVRRGDSMAAVRAAVCIAPATAAPRGRSSQTAFRPATKAASVSMSSVPIHASSTR